MPRNPILMGSIAHSNRKVSQSDWLPKRMEMRLIGDSPICATIYRNYCYAASGLPGLTGQDRQ